MYLNYQKYQKYQKYLKYLRFQKSHQIPEIGQFRHVADDLEEEVLGELGDLGVGFPPYHGLCRTTTVAEVE